MPQVHAESEHSIASIHCLRAWLVQTRLHVCDVSVYFSWRQKVWHGIQQQSWRKVPSGHNWRQPLPWWHWHASSTRQLLKCSQTWCSWCIPLLSRWLARWWSRGGDPYERRGGTAQQPPPPPRRWWRKELEMVHTQPQSDKGCCCAWNYFTATAAAAATAGPRAGTPLHKDESASRHSAVFADPVQSLWTAILLPSFSVCVKPEAKPGSWEERGQSQPCWMKTVTCFSSFMAIETSEQFHWKWISSCSVEPLFLCLFFQLMYLMKEILVKSMAHHHFLWHLLCEVPSGWST